VRQSAWRPSRNCRTSAELRFGQAREPRSGRSEAEGLDQTADRRTISRRDGRGARDLGARQRTCKANEARWWMKGRRRRSTGRRSRNSERVRAHLYQREFRAKPVSRADGSSERRRARGRIMRRTRQVPGPGAVPPDERDMRLGGERPPKIGRGTVIGGWQRGSLTPQMPRSLLPTAARTVTRAANNAARLRAVKLLLAKNIATSPAETITLLWRAR
jgi:hypothetical protein